MALGVEQDKGAEYCYAKLSPVVRQRLFNTGSTASTAFTPHAEATGLIAAKSLSARTYWALVQILLAGRKSPGHVLPAGRIYQ
jgi:hypothetical protein